MRAQFYSLIAVVIAFPIMIFAMQYLTYSQKSNYSISDRVISDQLHQLVNSIELDTEKAMEISGRRALIAATNFVLNSGAPFSNANDNLTELMLYGSINGTENFMMMNNTMANWSYRISSIATDFDVFLEYGNISIENNNGFSLLIGMDLNMTITDKLKITKMEKINSRKSVTISVVGMEDPIFPLNTQGFVRRIIRLSSPVYFTKRVLVASDNSSGSCSGDVTFNKSECDTNKILVADDSSGVTFACHLGIILDDNEDLSGDTSCYLTGNGSSVNLVNETVTSSGYWKIYVDEDSKSAWSMPGAENLGERYYYKGSGPDFLQRLEGNYSPSSKGIVTFIYLPELEEQAYPVGDYSRVAYRFFSDQGTCDKVRNAPGWFGLDNTHAPEFNLTDILTADTCDQES